MERRLHRDQGNSLDVFQNFVIGWRFFWRVLSKPLV